MNTNDVDKYGQRYSTQPARPRPTIPPAPQLQKPVIINSTADIQQVCKMAADAVNASARKIAGDILAAADAVTAIAEYITRDAEKFADYVEANSMALSDRVNQFAVAGNTVAQSFRDSKEHVMAMQKVLIAPALPPQKSDETKQPTDSKESEPD
jgi:hypothetical protein